MIGTVINDKGNEIKVNIVKCKRPKFSNHRGRTWDSGKIQINEVIFNPWLDTTWGEYLYFIYENQWYKVKMWGGDSWDDSDQYDIDPFCYPLTNIVIENEIDK